MELQLVDEKSKSVGKEKVDASIFKAPVKQDLLHGYVVMQRRARRAGTHSTKTRTEVTATGKKPFAQKGTGRARQGSEVAPHMVGGGIAFGPKPRSYKTTLNKKVRKEALRCALSYKSGSEKLAIVKSFEIKSGKTKDAAKILDAHKVKSLLIIGDLSVETKRSMRNLKSCNALSPKGLNVYDVLKHDRVLITKDGLVEITERLKAKGAA